jgi:hypothetical protein
MGIAAYIDRPVQQGKLLLRKASAAPGWHTQHQTLPGPQIPFFILPKPWLLFSWLLPLPKQPCC